MPWPNTWRPGVQMYLYKYIEITNCDWTVLHTGCASMPCSSTSHRSGFNLKSQKSQIVIELCSASLPCSLSWRSGYNLAVNQRDPHSHTPILQIHLIYQHVEITNCDWTVLSTCHTVVPQCLLLALDRVTTLLSTNQMSTPTLPLQDGREGNVLPFCMKIILPSLLRHQLSFWTRPLFSTGPFCYFYGWDDPGVSQKNWNDIIGLWT